MTSRTLPHTHTPLCLRSITQFQDGGLIATHSSILPTLRNHIYQSPRRHHVRFATHTFLHFFRKIIFQNFWGPFPGPQGLLPLIFEFPFSRYIPSNFSRRFDLNFHFLLHVTSFHLLLGLVNIFFRSKVHD